MLRLALDPIIFDPSYPASYSNDAAQTSESPVSWRTREDKKGGATSDTPKISMVRRLPVNSSRHYVAIVSDPGLGTTTDSSVTRARPQAT